MIYKHILILIQNLAKIQKYYNKYIRKIILEYLLNL